MNETSGNTKLEEALGISPQSNTNTQRAVVVRPSPPVQDDNTIQTDSEYARQEIYDLVSKGGEAIDQIMEVARESQHPRAYEVLAQMLKTQSDNVDKLLRIQKERKDLLKPDQEGTNKSPINVANAVFVGTSSDLIRMIRQEERNDGHIINVTPTPIDDE
jgi:hypothetical protein